MIAKSRNHRSLHYNIDLRRAVLEGVMNVLYEYVRGLSDDIRDLRWEAYRQIIVVVSDSDSDIDREDEVADIDELFV